MNRRMLFAVSDRPSALERIRAAFEPETEVVALAPHADSVIAAAAILEPAAVIVDLSDGCTQSAATTTRVLEEMPELRVVALLNRESHPDVKRRGWLEAGLELDTLTLNVGPELARGLELAFRGRVRAICLDAKADETLLGKPLPEVVYSPTFSC
ncbi:MAG: response regulator transcription factor [Bryobacterales bacterium]|nr:response regulator transcription factor [Acidobacteriota bacterium]MCB9384254.1 response regulator transcription factor [Bryobacterales bacterium]